VERVAAGEDGAHPVDEKSTFLVPR